VYEDWLGKAMAMRRMARHDIKGKLNPISNREISLIG
jgi:hypothetical protein